MSSSSESSMYSTVSTVTREKELEDVACVVFYPREPQAYFWVYLVDISKGELRCSVQLDAQKYPCDMTFLVHKGMLYMFGGETFDGPTDTTGLRISYALDLYELSLKSYGGQKPLPTEMPLMNVGKVNPLPVVAGNTICVLDRVLGNKPYGGDFEFFDLVAKTWSKVPNPFEFKPLDLVAAHCVKHGRLFVSFHRRQGIYALDLSRNTSPVWSHYDVVFGVHTLPDRYMWVEMGSLMLSIDAYSPEAYDFEAYDLDTAGFTRNKVVQWSTVETADEQWEAYRCLGRWLFPFSSHKVGFIEAELLFKPLRKRCSPLSVLIRRKKSSTPLPLLLKSRRRKGVHRKGGGHRKGASRKATYRFTVTLYDVDSAFCPISLKSVKTFSVPMNIEGKVESGYIGAASLCYKRGVNTECNCDTSWNP